MNFDKLEQDIILFWQLSCEDHSMNHWGKFCDRCPIKKQCEQLRQKLINTFK